MYLTVKQQFKNISKDKFLSLRELSYTAKNLYNKVICFYFQEKKYLNYQNNYAILKISENYKLFNSNMAR